MIDRLIADGYRAESCVEALEGCPDPTEFVRVLRYRLNECNMGPEGNSDADRDVLNHPALSWLKAANAKRENDNE